MDWYPRNPRKFDMGTLGWSLAERGAYSCLVDAYYENEGPLPADPAAIAATLRVDIETWQVISGKVLSKFEVRDGLLFHEVCEKELATQKRLSERSRENGKKGGRPKSKEKQEHKPNRFDLGILEKTQTKPQDITEQDKESPSLRSGDNAAEPLVLAVEEPFKKKAKTPRGSRLEPKMALPEAWALWAKSEGHPDPQAEWEQFRDYWISVAGKDGIKTNWEATWRNRVRRVMQEGRPAKRMNGNHGAVPMTEAEKVQRLERFVRHFRYNPDQWHGEGPEPGKPGCTVPSEILAKYGFESGILTK